MAKNGRKNKNSGAMVPVSRTMFKPNDAYNNNSKSKVIITNQRFRGGKGARASQALAALPPTITSYVDPWCDAADGVRWPDAFRGHSGTFASTLEGRLTTAGGAGSFTDLNMAGVTPTAGTALCLFTPDPSNPIVQGVCGNNSSGYFAGAPDQFHWPNGIVFTNAVKSLNAFGPGSGLLNKDIALPNINVMRQLYSGSRLVAGGVRITGTMNFSTVSGTIHLAPIFVSLSRETSNGHDDFGQFIDPTKSEMQNGWQTALPSNFADMANLPGYASYPLSTLQSDEIAAIFKRFGEEALLFKPVTTAWGMDDNSLGSLASRYGDSDNPNSYGHYATLVFIDGVLDSTGGPAAEATALVEFELRNHYECEANPGASARFGGLSGPGGIASQAPPYQPILMAALDNISADVPAIRCVDNSGISETGFIKEVARAWKGACAVAGSVATAVEIGTGLLAAFAI